MKKQLPSSPFTDIFSEEQVQKYLNGNLTPVEMHAIEKAMQDNPFAAEAIEGLELLKKPLSPTIEQLKKQMPYHQTNSVQKFGGFGSRKIWVAAASVVLLIGMALAFSLYNNSAQEMGEATAFEVSTTSANQAAPMSVVDSVGGDTDREATPKDKAEAPPANDFHSPQNDGHRNKQDKLSKPLILQRKMAEGEEAEQRKQAEQLADIAKEESEDLKRPVVADTKQLENSKKAIISTLSAKDAAKESKSAAKKDLSTSDDNLASPSRTTTAKVDLRTIDIEQPTPLMGWEAYNKYMDKKVSRLNSSQKGVVIIEATLNEQGEIIETKVIQSLDKQCDALAEKTVKEGGKWKIYSKKAVHKVKINVNF